MNSTVRRYVTTTGSFIRGANYWSLVIGTRRAWMFNLAGGLVAMPWFCQIWFERRYAFLWTWIVAPVWGISFLSIGLSDLSLDAYLEAWVWIASIGAVAYAAVYLWGVADAWTRARLLDRLLPGVLAPRSAPGVRTTADSHGES